jgi:hypothetical protein
MGPCSKGARAAQDSRLSIVLKLLDRHDLTRAVISRKRPLPKALQPTCNIGPAVDLE